MPSSFGFSFLIYFLDWQSAIKRVLATLISPCHWDTRASARDVCDYEFLEGGPASAIASRLGNMLPSARLITRTL